MSEYWLISAPGDKTCQQTWETMNNLTSKQHNLSENFKFHSPDLKVRKFILEDLHFLIYIIYKTYVRFIATSC